MFTDTDLNLLALSDAAEDTERDRKPERNNYIWVSLTKRKMQKVYICSGGIESMTDEERQEWIDQGYIKELQ